MRKIFTLLSVFALSLWVGAEVYAANPDVESDALDALVGLPRATTLEDGGIYYIVCDYSLNFGNGENKGDAKAMCNKLGNTSLYWNSLSLGDKNFLFRLTKSNDQWYIQNVASELYVGTGDANIPWTVDASVLQTITDDADASYTTLGNGTGKFKITNSGANQIAPTSYGTGAHDAECGQQTWGTDNNGNDNIGFPGRWRFYQVDEDDIDDDGVKLITSADGLQDGKYYILISQWNDFRALAPKQSGGMQNYGGYEAAMGYSKNDTEHVCWVSQNKVAPNPITIMRFIKEGEYWYMQNMATGKYVGEAANSMVGWTDEPQFTQRINASSVTEGAFNVSNSQHPEGWYWKIGGAYHVSDNGIIGSNSTAPLGGDWKIYELTEEQVNDLTETFANDLNVAIKLGVGYVNGAKDEASLAALKEVVASDPDYDDIRTAYNDYVLKFNDGYYRVVYPYVDSEDWSAAYLGLSAEGSYATSEPKTDYATIFKYTYLEDRYDRTISDVVGAIGYFSSQEMGFTYTSANQTASTSDTNKKMYFVRPDAFYDNGSYYLTPNNPTSFHDSHYMVRNTTEIIKFAYISASNIGGQAYLEPATEIAIELHQSGDNYWATINVPFGITLPEGTEAYVGKVEDDNFMLTSIGQEVPAGTPVILCGDSESITAQITDNAQPSTADNDLSGIYLADTDANDGILTLGEHNGQIGFYKSAFALGANKAYLNAPVAAGSNGFKIVFDDSDLTGIGTATADAEADNAALYDLYGRKVTNPVKGNLYIKNGKVIKQ